MPTGFRFEEPLKMTSDIKSLRRNLAELSPITQRIASMTFDLPQPLGPTMATRGLLNCKTVGSTNDLKPTILICFKNIFETPKQEQGIKC